MRGLQLEVRVTKDLANTGEGFSGAAGNDGCLLWEIVSQAVCCCNATHRERAMVGGGTL